MLITLLAAISGAAALYFPTSQKALADFKATEAVFTSLGATFGTILALVLTLSIIPIQRAGEVWSPSIMRLYRRDRLTHITFIVLGILCAVSFMLAVNGVSGVSVSIVMATAIVALGLSLDLLRWYHRHICKLLDPAHAIGVVTKYAHQTIDQIQRTANKLAKLQYRNIPTEKKGEIIVEDLETAIYPHLHGYPDSVNFWIHDVAEIAGKAAARGEKYLASTAINAIQEITNHFLSVRKNNLALFPAPEALFLAMESDVKIVVDQAYEVLQEISHTAVVNSDESVALKVSEAFKNIATHTENLKARSFRPQTAPLTATPIAYLLSSVKYAQEKGLNEVPFQSAEILARISLAAPKDISLTDVHIPVIDGISDIAMHLYVKQNAALAEHVVGHIMAVLNHMLDCKEYHYHELLRHVFEKLEVLAPLAVINEKLAGPLSITHPLGKAYGLTNHQSLGYLFSKATSMVKVDTEREWVNPYHDLIEIADLYYRHFRNLGEKVEFGDSFFLWELTHLIKHVATVIGQLILNPVRPEHGDEQELIGKLQWIMSFFWVAFDKKKTVDHRRADEACDVLAYVGIMFFEHGHPDVLRTNVSHIGAIIKSYCQIAQPLNNYAVGDLFAHLWCLRILTVARDNDALINDIDKMLNTKPEPLIQDQWQQAEHAIELRRAQLLERLEERNERYGQDTSEELLKRVLEKAEHTA